MTNGNEGQGLQALVAQKPTPPPMPISASPVATQGGADDTFGARVKKLVLTLVKDEIADALRPVHDSLEGIREQYKTLVDRMDAAGKKDDDHDGELEGIRKGLKDAEASIRDVNRIAEAAQKAVDTLDERLTHELAGL